METAGRFMAIPMAANEHDIVIRAMLHEPGRNLYIS